MGMFGDLMQSLSESPGRILWTQLADTQQKMARLAPTVRTAALLGFVKKREALISQLDNMTQDGRIKLGKDLQSEARRTLDMNVSEGYALWLTGAWLESMNRPGIEAAKTVQFLEEVAQQGGGTPY